MVQVIKDAKPKSVPKAAPQPGAAMQGGPANAEGQQAAALLFVQNLQSDKTLSDAWSRLLGKIAAALKAATGAARDAVYQQAIQAADNFIADHNYNTTSDAVFALLKSDFYEEHLKESEPNAESDRFAQALLTDAATFKAWQSLVLQVGAGTADSTGLDAFLAKQGYACTFKQVNASFVKMRNHQLSYWSGTYNTSLVPLVGGQPSGAPTAGPTLAIFGYDDVQLVGDTSMPVSELQYANGTLKWKKGLLGTYDGAIVFSEIAIPAKSNPYTGPLFSGTFIKPADADPFGTDPPQEDQVFSVVGQLAPDPNNAQAIPAEMHPDLLQKIMKWVNYIIVGLVIVKTVVSMGKKHTNVKEFNQATDGACKDTLDRAQAQGKPLEGEIAGDTSTPYENIDFAQSDVLKKMQEDLDSYKEAGDTEGMKTVQRQMEEEARAEDEYDRKPTEEADVEGEGWASDLKVLAEI